MSDELTFFMMLMRDEIFHIICSRKNGATKNEIIAACQLFGYCITPSMWHRMLRLTRMGVDFGYYCENKRWYSMESSYYKSIVEFVHNNEQGVTNMGMAMGCLPSWIDENHDLFIEFFNLSDY